MISCDDQPQSLDIRAELECVAALVTEIIERHSVRNCSPAPLAAPLRCSAANRPTRSTAPDHGPVSRISVCPRCTAQFAVCESCERGQLYCGQPCAGQARCASLKAIRRRYRRSLEGKAAHRDQERQRRQRRRSEIGPVEFVGDQGSPTAARLATLVPAAKTRSAVPLSCIGCSITTHYVWANSGGRRPRGARRRCRPTSTVKRSRI